MAEFKVENLCGFLIRSKLMVPDDMQAMRQRWLAEAKENAGQVPLFLKWMVSKNYVTEYQASLLSRGHIDDFFLGEYKVLERIGRGRMAGVFKAIHGSGQVVAIKVLPPSKAKHAQILARFQREARLASKLKHPNLVRAYQVGEARGVHYLVMEYLEGETLEDVLHRRKRLPPGEAVRIAHQTLLGLQHLHEQNMVHRDLKPANLMLLPAPVRGDNETTLRSVVKILDIGLAREFFDEKAPDNPGQMELTGEGVLLSTPDYLAPEQARDPRQIDIRADIYSLGCTLYHMLAGQSPFRDKNILNQMIRHASEAPRPLQEHVPTIPEGLNQIVGWMIAKQPDKRYPTPARAAQALDAYMIVARDEPKEPAETPALKKYLTWLELGDPPADGEKTLPPPAIPTAPLAPLKSDPKVPIPSAKPASDPRVPIASAKPVPDAKPKPAAKPAQPEKRRKKNTGVKMPAPPAAVPVPTADPIPPGPEQFDVELVELPTPTQPAKPPSRLGRDIQMFLFGAIVMLVLTGAGAGIWFLIQLFQ